MKIKINCISIYLLIILQCLIKTNHIKLNEFHLADIDAEIDKALQNDEDLKDNYAYRQVLKTMLLNNEKEAVKKDNEELQSSPDDKKYILDQQLKKLFGFLNRNISKTKSYLSQNQKAGKSGLSWVYQDILRHIKNYDSSSKEVQNFTKIVRLLQQYPSAILHHDFLEKHNQFFDDQNSSNFRKKREQDLIQYYSDRDYQYIIDETDDFKNSLTQILKDLPNNIDNDSFKDYSLKFLDTIQSAVNKNKDVIENKQIPKFEQKISKFKKFLSSLKVLNQDEIKEILYILHFYIEKKMKNIATPQGYQEFQNELKNLATKIQQKKQNFSRKYPMRKPLQKDIDEFVNTLTTKILKTDQFKNLDNKQMIKLEKLLNIQLDQEFKGIDKKRFYNDIQKFSQDLNLILNKNLKDSLSQQNLKNVTEQMAQYINNDINNIKNKDSKTGLSISNEQIQNFADKLFGKIKSMHEKNGKIRFTIPLKQTDILVQELTNIIKKYYKPEKLQNIKEPEQMAQQIIKSEEFLNSFENEVYDALNKQSLKNEYYQFAKDILKKRDRTQLQFQNELNSSEFYNYIQQLLHQDQTEIQPVRLLTTLLLSQNKNIRKLSKKDTLVLKYLRNLCLRWNKNYHNKVNYAKIYNQELRKLAKIVYYNGFDIQK